MTILGINLVVSATLVSYTKRLGGQPRLKVDMAEICLVSCASTELEEPAKAEDLYVSPLFIKAKKFAQLSADKWFILSAKHRLLDPKRRIKPYDKTLLLMPTEQRKKWASKVAKELR